MKNQTTNWLSAERHRHVLWLPVLLGLGMSIYFALKFEPEWWFYAPLAVLGGAGLFWKKSVFWPIAAIVFGLIWAAITSHYQAVTMLNDEVKITTVSGRIAELGDMPKAWRITLDDVHVEGLKPEDTPQRIRLKVRGSDKQSLITGQHIELRAGLLPPAGPVMPGAFDFQRFFFFRDIGAVGYGLPPIKVLDYVEDKADLVPVTRWRQLLSERVRRQLPPEEGAVAAALMTGDRSAIPDEVTDVMRTTNLSHILAISGMHMAMITGMIFMSLRFMLVRIPFTRNLRYGKKIAASLALVAGAFYLMMSGMPISAVRAFVMVALLLGAVLIDREPSPMRSLATAALILLLYDPSNLLEPGFQLSFGATCALIAWYEMLRGRADRALLEGKLTKRLWIYIAGIFMTTIVAEIATMPLVLYHFNTVSLYGLLANMLVMPLVSIVIMPGIVLSFLAMPFGLDYWPLQFTGWGIGAMIYLADWTANIPFARFFMPAFPWWGMGLISLGGLWLMLWQKRLRFVGIVPIIFGSLSLFLVDLPDVLISKDAKQIAVMIDGDLRVVKGRASSFVTNQWANGYGYKTLSSRSHPGLEPGYIPKIPDSHSGFRDVNEWRCDTLGCVYRHGDTTIAFPIHQAALPQDCAIADRVVVNMYVDYRLCKKEKLIDRNSLKKGGAHWLWLGGDEIRVGNSKDVQGRRVWSR